MIRIFALLSTLLLLSACANMTFKGLYEMATFDLYELDPHQLKIAIRTDKSLEVKQGNVVIFLSYISDDETLYIKEKFLPEVTQRTILSGELADGLLANEKIIIFNLESTDAQKMRDTVLQAKGYKDNDKKGTGSFGISVENLCFDEEYLVNADIDILIQKSEQDEFFMFLEDLNLKQLTDTDPKNKEAMAKLLCKNQQTNKT